MTKVELQYFQFLTLNLEELMDNNRKKKNAHTPLNYHYVVNVPHKLLIVSMTRFKLQKNANISQKVNKKTKITLEKFQ